MKLRLRAPSEETLWSAAEVAGAALLGGGVWSRWGASWACMLWGLGILYLSDARARRLNRPGGDV